MSNAIRLTVNERVLIHLDRFHRFEDEWEVPADVSQKGIADAVGIRRNEVPRAVKALEKQKLLTSRSARVRGYSRSIKVYFLTPEGAQKAHNIRDHVGSLDVHLKDEDGAMDVTFSDALESIGGRLSFLEVLSNIDGNGILDLTDPELGSADGKGKTFIKEGVPPQRPFWGRRRSLIALMEGLKQRPVSSVRGMAGVGKTALVQEAVQMSSCPVLWHRGNPWDSVDGMVMELASFLLKLDNNSLQKACDQEDRSSTRDLSYPDIFRTIEDSDIWLIIDDVHRCPEDVFGFLSAMVENASPRWLCRIILITQEDRRLYPKRRAITDGLVKEVTLEGMDLDEALPFISSLCPDLPSQGKERLWKMAGGHPLAIRIMAASESGKSTASDLDNYIETDVLGGLDPNDRMVLAECCVSRGGIPPRLINIEGMEPGERDSSLDNLMRRSLLERTVDGISVPGIIRSHVLGRWDPVSLKRTHQRLARRFKEAGDQTRNLLEHAYHLGMSGELTRAIEVLTDLRQKAIEEGMLGPLLEVARCIQLESGSPSGPEASGLDDIISTVLESWGGWDAHGEALFQSAFLAEAIGLDFSMEGLPRTLSHTARETETLEHMIDRHMDSLGELERLKDRRGMADIHSELANLKWLLGRSDDAVDHLNLRSTLLENEDDPGAIIATETWKCTMLWSEGNFQEALNGTNALLKSTGGEVAKRKGEINKGTVPQRIRALSLLGMIQWSKKDTPRAIDAFEQCRREAAISGYLQAECYSLLHLAQCAYRQGDISSAEDPLEWSRERLKLLGDRIGSSYSRILALLMDAKRGNTELALRSAEEILLGDERDQIPFQHALVSVWALKITRDKKRSVELEKRMIELLQIAQALSWKSSLTRHARG